MTLVPDYSKINPIPNGGGGIFTPPNKLSQISKKLRKPKACAFLYVIKELVPDILWKFQLDINMQTFFMIFHRKMVDTKSSKFAQNGKIFKM